jgi:hypothetical protein
MLVGRDTKLLDRLLFAGSLLLISASFWLSVR